GAYPGTNGNPLYLRTSTDNGSNFDAGASDYRWATYDFDMSNTGSMGGIASSADSEIHICNSNGNATDQTLDFTIDIYNPSSSTMKFFDFHGVASHSASPFPRVLKRGSGARLSTTAVNAIRFLFATSNIVSGTFKVYGLKAS